MIGKKTYAAVFAALATLAAWTASAQEASCTCVCDNGSPDWACTAPPVNPLLGGGTTTPLPPMPDSCATMSCPGADAGDLLGGGDGSAGTTDGGLLGGGDGSTGDATDDGGLLGGGDGSSDDDADDQVDSPVAGYKCKRRAIYRPDLKKQKIYKVCRPILSDEERAEVAERYRQMREEWKAAKRRHKSERHSQWASYKGERDHHHHD